MIIPSLLESWSLQSTSALESSVGSQIILLRSSFFGLAGGIKLKGTAAIIKEFGKVLHAIWIIYWSPDKALHKLVELCLRTGNAGEDILKQHRTEFVLPGIAHFVLLPQCLRCLMLLFSMSYVSETVSSCSPLAHTGPAAAELKALMSVHFRSFWELREWARKESLQLFALTEKALFVRVLLMAS